MIMLTFNDGIEKMLKSVASELKIGYQKFKARQEFYNFIYNDKILVSFSILLDPRTGNINFLANVTDMKPSSWGSFKKEEFVERSITILENWPLDHILDGMGELLDNKIKKWVKKNLVKDTIFLLKAGYGI